MAVEEEAPEAANDAEPFIEGGDTPWGRVRLDAERDGDGPPLYRYLLWVERKCVAAGLHAMDPAWLRHFRAFYESGKFVDVGRFGVRAAKSDSVCRALVAEVILGRRILEPSIIGVCPVMSANMREAGDRFDTVKANLRACGLRDLAGTRQPAEEGGFKSSGGGNQALVIELFDSQAHAVEFRIYPASEAGAAGFTGIAGFGDELDLWGKATGANPAAKVLRVLRSRYTSQPDAKLHLMSATYDRESEHAKLIGEGDGPDQYVAKIGVEGATKDHEHRIRLAKLIQSIDPLLLAGPLDPGCTDIPCWVTNPITPIEEAYKKARGNLREMFALFGGRLELAGGGAAISLEDLRWMAAQNRALNEPVGRTSAQMADDYMRGMDDEPDPRAYRGL